MPIHIASIVMRDLVSDLSGMLAITATEKDVDFKVNVSDSVFKVILPIGDSSPCMTTNQIDEVCRFDTQGKILLV